MSRACHKLLVPGFVVFEILLAVIGIIPGMTYPAHMMVMSRQGFLSNTDAFLSSKDTLQMHKFSLWYDKK